MIRKKKERERERERVKIRKEIIQRDRKKFLWEINKFIFLVEEMIS